MPRPIDINAYCNILDVPRGATKEQIREAYKKMALKWHPDRHTTDKENASQKFIEIHNAYRILMARRERSRPHRRPKHRRDDSNGSESSSRPSSPRTHQPTSSASEQRSDTSTHSRSHSAPPSTSASAGHDDSSSSQYADARSSSCHSYTETSSGSASPYSEHSSSSSCSSSSGNSPNLRTPPPSSPRSDSRWAPPHSSATPKTSKSTRAKLRKSPPPRPDQQFTPKRQKSNHSSTTDSDGYVHLSDCTYPSPTFRSPKDKPNKCDTDSRFSIRLPLEDFFYGTRHRYRFTRHHLSGKLKPILLDIKVPPGCRPGTKILYPGIGHERKDAPGTFQDVVIVIEQIPHERFARERNDLVLEVELPWIKVLEEECAEAHLEGLDGEPLEFVIDPPVEKSMRGKTLFPGAGMPIREGGEIVGRGDLIVKWEITSPSVSKWDTLKKVLHFDR